MIESSYLHAASQTHLPGSFDWALLQPSRKPFSQELKIWQ
jgi:hypothetical protein